MAARSIAVPLSPAFPAPELQYILNQSEASLLVSSAKFAAKAKEVLTTDLNAKPAHLELQKHVGGGSHEKVELGDSNPGEAGMMLYTSGTTNRPVRQTVLYRNTQILTSHPERCSTPSIGPDGAVSLPARGMGVLASRSPPSRPPSSPHPRHR